MAGAPSPCQMPHPCQKPPHPATYPHYPIPLIGLTPATCPHPHHHHPLPYAPTYPHVCVCVAQVSMWSKYVYVVKVCMCGGLVIDGWVSIKVICHQVPYLPPKIKVICRQVSYSPQNIKSNWSSSTIHPKKISK